MNEVCVSHGTGEGSRVLPGFLKAGMWLQTGAQANGLARESDLPNTGFYLLADQLLLPECPTDCSFASEGLGAFAGLGFAPPDRNIVDFYLNAGLSYKGLIPGRNQDTCGLAIGMASPSKGADRVLREEGLSPEAAEMVLEATYQCVLAPCCFVQPDLQYIINPGATANLADALVLGMRFTVVF